MEPERFKQVTLDHKDRLYTYAARLLGDVEEARDVTQEALMRLWIDRHRVVREATTTWLLRTTYRLCMDRLRRRRRRAPGNRDLTDLVGDHEHDPSEIVSQREQRAALVRALDVLPFRDRAIILLRDVQGLSYDELTAVLDMPLGSIKAALHRARQRLSDEVRALEVNP